MKTTLKELTIRDLVSGYKDSGNEGVVAFNGDLDVRPAYQREYVYDDKKRNAVIDTVLQNAPLNNMYWILGKDGKWEQLDGQQRTISICQYIDGVFAFNGMYFHSLSKDEQNKILNYQLQLYICEGTKSEKLSWFERINIAGEVLSMQELRNGIFVGEWLSDAKLKFSKPNCVAYGLGSKYLKGVPIRQDYLETAIKWITNSKKHEDIKGYMSEHQHDKNAKELYKHFKHVIKWVEQTFPEYRSEMKGLPWGELYHEYKDREFDAIDLEKEISKLMQDDEVKSKKGVYQYLLTGGQKYLSIRVFDKNQKRYAFEHQSGICAVCHEQFKFEQMEGDHIIPWSKGGITETSNCQMLCVKCNREKGSK